MHCANYEAVGHLIRDCCVSIAKKAKTKEANTSIRSASLFGAKYPNVVQDGKGALIYSATMSSMQNTCI